MTSPARVVQWTRAGLVGRKRRTVVRRALMRLEIQLFSLDVDGLEELSVYGNLVEALHAYGGLRLFGSDGDIVNRHAVGQAQYNALFGVGDGDVLQVDVLDGHLGQTVEEYGATRTLAGDIGDVDVAESRCLLGHGRHGLSLVLRVLGGHFRRRLAAVEEVEQDGLRRDVYHVDVADVDVLHQSAASCSQPPSGWWCVG